MSLHYLPPLGTLLHFQPDVHGTPAGRSSGQYNTIHPQLPSHSASVRLVWYTVLLSTRFG